MAIKTVQILVDDFDGAEGAITTPFSLDGVDYEIDLAPRQRDKLQRAMAPYIAKARRQIRTEPAEGRSGRHSVTKRSTKKRSHKTPPGQKEQLDAIRDWARKNGRTVSDRGRVPQEVKAAFDEAHTERPERDGVQQPVAFSG